MSTTGERKLSFSLPWPPSVNSYWRSIPIRKRVAVLISAKGREYRKDVVQALTEQGVTSGFGEAERLAVAIQACPPDARKRDLDNLPKAVLDALTHAGLWGDDSQIDELLTRRRPKEAGGVLYVDVRVMRASPPPAAWAAASSG